MLFCSESSMRILLFVAALLLFLDQTSGSFIHGQPCSDRNTAYLYVNTWRLPLQKEINCVDITGFKKSLSTTFNLSNYVPFLERVASADTLYADHMGIKKFPILIVHSLPNTEVIDMSANNLTKLPNKMYKVAPKLNKLLLSENRISVPKKRPLMSSPTLKTLMLSDNGITNLYKLTFAKLPELEVLYLDSNKLKFISPRMFSAVRNLRYLHLGKNYIAKVPPKSVMPPSIVHYITKSQRPDKRRSVKRRDFDRHRNRQLVTGSGNQTN
ncbi:hypothetical protein NQ315_006313 [Exocentrus adspersus]|uniref:Uncharacterized protein n=1 Tax=Exocentrus adspersus TaxID=1586481 RepID=A0AAV8W0F4_9CUCU|nr:hypothetical protein NQ315_006313 [Exocentrus adspersus]